MLYLWVKALHVIFVIAWMAGLLMLPRLRIYQLSGSSGDPLFEQMKEASARLRKIILTPALVAVWLLGIAMVVLQPGLLQQGWLHAKILLVLIITGLHGYFVSVGRKIDSGESSLTERRLRAMNEVPFIAMIGVVILVVVKPF